MEHDGYRYILCSKKIDFTYYRCAQKRGKLCKASLKVKDTECILLKEHNHPKQELNQELQEFKLKLRMRAVSEHKNLKDIYDEEALKNPVCAIQYSWLTAQSFMRAIRRRSEPAIPNSMDALGNILCCKEFGTKFMCHGELLCKAIVTAGDGSYNLVFFCQNAVDSVALHEIDEIHGDASFKIVPVVPAVKQLFVLHLIIKEHSIPILFAMMEKVSFYAYCSIIEYFKEKVLPAVNPKLILSDYDPSMQQAFAQVYPSADVQGYFFQYTQAVWRRMKKNGYLKEMQKNVEMQTCIRMCLALPLLPSYYIAETFEEIKKYASDKNCNLSFFFEYIQSYWIDIIGVEKMSVHKSPNRTNNNVEGFNNILKQKVGELRPEVYAFIGKLSKVIEGLHLNILQLDEAHVTRSKKFKYFLQNRKILDAFKQLTESPASKVQCVKNCGLFVTEIDLDNEYLLTDEDAKPVETAFDLALIGTLSVQKPCIVENEQGPLEMKSEPQSPPRDNSALSVSMDQSSSGMDSALSDTLNLFDSFKSHEEEKDSDEESFHLHLEGDDENETANKEAKKSKEDENEDEILNKFENVTSNTPDIDLHLEETLLNEQEEPVSTSGNLGGEEKNGAECMAVIGAIKQEIPEASSDKTDEESFNEDKDVKDVNFEPAPEEGEEACSMIKENGIIDGNVDEDKLEPEPELMDVITNKAEENNRLDSDSNSRETVNQAASLDSTTNDEVTEENDEILLNAEDEKMTEETGASNKDTEEKIDEEPEEKTCVENEETPMQVDDDNFTAQNGLDEEVRIENEENVPQSDLDEEMRLQNEENIPQTDLDEEMRLQSEKNIPQTCESEEKIALAIKEEPELLEPTLEEKELEIEDKVKEVDETVPEIIEEKAPETEDSEEKEPEIEDAEEKMEAIEPQIENDKEQTEEPEAAQTARHEESIEPQDVPEKQPEVAQDEEPIKETEEIEPNENEELNAEEGSLKEPVTLTEDSGNAQNEQYQEPSKPAELEPSEETTAIPIGEVLNENSSNETAKETVELNEKPAETCPEPEVPEPSKSPNLDSEDLLDISIIRDTEEDDAHLAQCLSTEKEDNQDDNSNEKTENDDAEKDAEPMDVEEEDDDDDDNALCLNLESERDEMSGDSERDETATETTNQLEKNLDEAMNDETGKISRELQTEPEGNDPDKENTVPIVNQDKIIENHVKEVVEKSTTEEEPSRTPKRTLSDTDNENEIAIKKPKLDEKAAEAPPKEDAAGSAAPAAAKSAPALNSLMNFSEFMKKNHFKKLTRAHLEEFCFQKICEAFVFKSEMADLNHQIRLHEQTLENFRKDQQQLTKQVKDLEIVNKKLMNELRASCGTKKPLVPLKITRSVGLQVKLATVDIAAKRRVVPTSAPQRAAPAAVHSPANNRRPVQNGAIRTANPSPQKQINATPILSNVLQNRRVQNVAKTATRVVNVSPQKKGSASVIDLTDEDDRRNEAMKKNTTANSIRPMATLAQGVRLATAPTQIKTTPISGVVTSTTPQLMYVLQSGTQLSSGVQGVLTTTAGNTQKALIVNIQGNNILTNALNGSAAVTMLPTKTVNTVQTKTIVRTNSASSISKHPAPLPGIPYVRVVGEVLKPIPPKPHLTIRKTDTGIILQWRMPYDLDLYETIASYQLYAYQETTSPPSTDMWRRVGDVKALALPMACTLTQFVDKNKYYFAVRPVDTHKRIGPFSDPEEISL